MMKLHDDYLDRYTPSKDVSENAAAVVSFDKFCSERNIKFLHVICPAKICVSEDKDISGVLDFSNQNADRFLEAISKFGVKYYDLRKALHDDGKPHHASFFVTDGHWKPETDLWAARHMLALLRDDFGWNVEPEILNPDRFDYAIYPSWFLGSSGKKFTHFRVKPDDLTMIYPKFETSIHYELPSLGIDTSGDFRITYDMTQVEEKDYYGKICYNA